MLLYHSPTLAMNLCNTGEPWGSTEDGRCLSNETATLDVEVGIFVSGKRWARHWDGTTMRPSGWEAWHHKGHRMTKVTFTCIIVAQGLTPITHHLWDEDWDISIRSCVSLAFNDHPFMCINFEHVSKEIKNVWNQNAKQKTILWGILFNTWRLL